MNENDRRLGRIGVARREALLRELRPLVVRRGRRRAVISAASTAAGLLVIAAAGVAGIQWAQRPSRPPQVMLEATEPPVSPRVNQARVAPRVEAPSQLIVEVVRTRPGLAEAVSVSPSGSRVQRVGDDDLLAALREAGQEPGLVRVDGRVVVAGDFGR